MESNILNEDKKIYFLPKPKIALNIYKSGTIWTNLLKFKQPKMKIYNYVCIYEPEIPKNATSIKRYIFSKIDKEVIKNFEFHAFTGDNLYSTVKMEENIKTITVPCKNGITYTLTIKKSLKVTELRDIIHSQEEKRIKEEFIRAILRANPYVEFFQDAYVKKNEIRTIQTIEFNPGYSSSIHQLASGQMISVFLKNKFFSKINCFEIINNRKKSNRNFTIKEHIEDINDFFVGKSVKTTYSNKNYKIHGVNFDKSPRTVDIIYKLSNMTLINYYLDRYKKDIKSHDQPLFEVLTYDSEQKEKIIYLVPELCILAGIDESLISDRKFMKELGSYTIFTPSQMVNKIQDFKNLLNETKKISPNSESSSTLKAKLGLEIDNKPVSISGLYLNEVITKSKLEGNANQKNKAKNFGTNNASTPNKFSNWLCFYSKDNYHQADYFFRNLKDACKFLNIELDEPNWAEVQNNTKDEWISEINAWDPSMYQFTIFILSEAQGHFYRDLKVDSLCENGYISQVVKNFSKKNSFSVAKNIALQIFSKIGKTHHYVDFKNEVLERDLMVVGVNSSHIKNKRTAVAMTASYDNNFSHYFNKVDIIEEKKKETISFSVSKFLEEAISNFFEKNQRTPRGVIIYRQGVSKEQKDILRELEIKNIDKSLNGLSEKLSFLKENPIPYYYIVVNKKTNFKFFEQITQKNKCDYRNPKSGLIIHDHITNPNIFEFYMQHQMVTQGTANPTNYHVAYGSLDDPHLALELTHQLTFSYPNWRGPIRVPSPLKCAEKLSYLTAKFLNRPIHENLQNKNSFL